MLPASLSRLTDIPGPFATAAIDASRVDPASSGDVQVRWEDEARRLLELGAPQAVVDAMSAAATAQTGLGGERTRVVVASGDRVVLDLVVPGRPVRPEALYGPVPQLMPVVRALSGAVTYAVARVDRAGADLEVRTPTGAEAEAEEVEGGHDVLHKTAAGGWSQRRYQARAQDSWDQNAGEVADRLASIVRQDKPQVVLVAGDESAIASLRRQVAPEVEERLVVLDSGGRAAGTSEEAEQEAVDRALEQHAGQRRAALLDRFREQLGRQQEAVEGVGPVVEALRRGQVEELLLHDDPSSTLRLWVGEEPLQLGLTEQDARAAGATRPQQTRADAALVWALLGSKAGMTLLPDGEQELLEGIGAVLRWSDEATKHLAAPSMPGHGQGPGMPENIE